MYKLGSLFDGSGGFPLAGTLCGIEPAWASEVEPYPIAVTRSRFPKMRHLGDISKVNGAEIEPVDIITFGSPCQDLSVAGKQAGIKHADNGDEETTRSGLFMEAVRIIKEMRSATNGKYPKFCIWENVPGAFSSNRGQDFRIVLEELIKIVEPSASMPAVPKGGWPYADCYVGPGWSLGYRLFDAQYWGVPQRRRRIHLVLDLTGERARSVLFEREGVRGYFAQGRTPWQDAPADAERSTGADDRAGEGFDGYNGDLTGGVSATLGVNCGLSSGRNRVIERDGRGRQLDGVIYPTVANTLTARADGSPQPDKGAGANIVAVGLDVYNQAASGDKAISIRCKGDNEHTPCVVYPIHDQDTRFSGKRGDKADGKGNGLGVGQEGDPMNTLTSGDRHAVVYSFDALASNSMKSANPHSGCREVNVAKTLDTTDPNPSKNQGGIAIVETIALEGNGQRPSHQGDGYAVTDKSYTLNTIERHGVVYAVDQGGGKSACNVTEELAPTLTCTHDGAPAVAHASDVEPKVIALDRAAFNQGANAQYDPAVRDLGVNSTLVARGPSAIAYAAGLNESQVSHTLIARMESAVGTTQDNLIISDYREPTRYIVRRLTPTECARLQGFADQHGDTDYKKHLTAEEYRFWLEVRKTYDAIQADAVIAAARLAIAEELERVTPRQALIEQKQRAIELAEARKAKDYTEKQMLTWYNKLHTDSAEYKMWGNGIALPPALYVMQGIRDALDTPVEDDDWMN